MQEPIKAAVWKDGGLCVVDAIQTGTNTATIDGVRHIAFSSVLINGQHIGFWKPQPKSIRAKLGNCPRCGGTGSFGTHGVCWDCNGSGDKRGR